MKRRSTLLALLISLVAALGIAGAPHAAAHDTLISSSPADGSTTERPKQIVLTFSASLVPTGAALKITGPDGSPITTEAPKVDGPKLTQALPSEAPAGAWKVTWRVISSDGHPISGSFGFTVKESAAPTSSAPVTSSAAASVTKATSSSPTPPAQQKPTDSTNNNLPLILTGAVGAVLLLGLGFVLARSRVRDDDHERPNDDERRDDA